MQTLPWGGGSLLCLIDWFCSIHFSLFREMHIISLSKFWRKWIFSLGKFGVVTFILKGGHVLKPVLTTSVHNLPCWEYPSKLWSCDLWGTLCPVALYRAWMWTQLGTKRTKLHLLATEFNQPPLALLDRSYQSITYVLCCPTFFLWCLWWNFFCFSALRCKSLIQRPNLWWVAISHVWV